MDINNTGAGKVLTNQGATYKDVILVRLRTIICYVGLFSYITMMSISCSMIDCIAYKDNDSMGSL